jgi:hypothetical protein
LLFVQRKEGSRKPAKLDMAGLVGYASSDDDDEVLSQPEAKVGPFPS